MNVAERGLGQDQPGGGGAGAGSGDMQPSSSVVLWPLPVLPLVSLCATLVPGARSHPVLSQPLGFTTDLCYFEIQAFIKKTGLLVSQITFISP